MPEFLQIRRRFLPAARNMAVDTILLEEADRIGKVILRFYGWREPAFTFGYSQRWEAVAEALGETSATCVRRLTGGGVVDHRADLTYALIVPPSNPNCRLAAPVLYKAIHEALGCGLAAAGVAAALAPCPKGCGDPTPRGLSLACFSAPEADDVIRPDTGQKLAGAAMKRNRKGLLVQGSILVGNDSGWPDLEFMEVFGHALAQWLGAKARPCASEEELPLSQSRLSKWEQTFADPGWNRRR